MSLVDAMRALEGSITRPLIKSDIICEYQIEIRPERSKIMKAWNWKHNWIRIVFEAFFCEDKGDEGDKRSFSSKKFFAFVLMALAIVNHAHLHLSPETHWVKDLADAGVADGVTIALIASLDALAAWALSVYGWAKAKGAA